MSSNKVNHINDNVINPNNSVERRDDEGNLKGSFGISRKEILDIFEKYDHRNFIEDVEALDSYGGISFLETSLKTDINNGLHKSDNIAEREEVFGSNALEQEPLPHCCSYVWEALEDLMLRILILAGIIQIILGSTPLSDHPDREWIEGFAIIVAVFVVVCVASLTNYNKEKKFKKLNDRNSAMVKVTIKRNGIPEDRSPDDLLVGDLVKINTGSIVPADGVLISTEGQVKIEESSLTGESDAIEKETTDVCLRKAKEFEGKETNKHSVPSPFVFSGTLVKEGGGWFIVLAVGRYSKKGMIKESVEQNQENDDAKTPLEQKLDILATQIGYFGMASAILTLVALFIRFGIIFSEKKTAYDNAMENPIPGQTPSDPKKSIAKDVVGIFLLCIAIVVVAIPEGLPLAVTLSLAFSINYMTKDNNLVRKMYACETMGGANYICSDKTGTLTMNVMNVFRIFNGKTDVDVSALANLTDTKDANNQDSNKIEIDIPSKKGRSSDYFNQQYFDIIVDSLSCNLQMTVDENENILDESKTDLAFANLLHSFDIAIYPIQTKYKVNQNDTRRIAFSSARKKMSTIVSHSSFPTGHRIFTKGASEIVLNSVTHYINHESGERTLKSDIDNEKFKKIIREYADLTYRTICVAYKDISENEAARYQDQDEEGRNMIENSDFTMVFIAGIKDTLRKGVKNAIESCHTAGINVVMVTGDLKETAIAISKECGIWNLSDSKNIPMYYSLTGEEFYNLIGGIECDVCNKSIKECTDPKTKREAKKREEEEKSKTGKDVEYEVQKHRIKDMETFKLIANDLRVLARSRPLDKYALVLGLRTLDNIVAVTGDGTNDAQALSKSDVGFAMGIEGTDVAKDAADIIILDDNFASIVKAVVWGRNIFDCIRKFIQFQLTVNVTACVLVFVTACIGSETPITAIQMLWLNMIMDSLGSLALATEPPHEKILLRQPNSRKEHIINYLMWKHILGQSIALFIILIILYLIGHEFLPESDLTRIAEAETIFYCYGKFPGKEPVDGKHTTMSGSISHWPADTYLKNNVTSVECGEYTKFQDMSLAFANYKSAYGNTAHMTILFNVFVLFCLFNQFNSRVITDEINIFNNINKNMYFVVLVLAEFVLQALLVQFGGMFFSCAIGGLTGTQWGICIGLGLSCFVVAIILKFIPAEKCIESMFNCFTKNYKNNKIEAEHNYRSENIVLNNNEDYRKKLSKESSRKRAFLNNVRKPSHILSEKQGSKMRSSKFNN